MKTRMILFAMGLMIMGASMSAQAQLPGPVEKTKMQGPDLITDGIREMDLNNGKLEVAVKNIGENASKKSVVRLKITPTDGLKDSLTANVKVLAPGEIVWIPMSFGKPLNLANYCAVADALKQNAETNEKNNEKCGQLSGKP